MVANKERIYVGGLDPSRGLTVELVASRLCSVDGVEILSINDVATTKSTSAVDNTTNRNASSTSTIYTKKQSIIDEDGDLVDTRNFFFLEARSTTTAATHTVDGDDNEKKSNTNYHNTQSALDILSKQYNSVKWKGCQLRVEYAKPHFLQRLQDERQERKQATQLKSAQDVINTRQQLEDEKTVIKCRRRLRIRKRFGEEAYHVDTRPHSIDLSSNNQYHQQKQTTTTNSEIANNNNNGGWDSFAFLHKRLKNKRKSQQLKLIERRKKERRLWASSSSNNKNEQENVDELNSLIFLNRGIHIRFNDEAVSSSLSSSMDKNRIDSSREVISAEETAAMKSTNEVEDNVEAYTSSSSSAVSSDSEDSTSVANREKKAYNWSDDSEEEEEEEEGMIKESSSSSQDSSTDGEEEDKVTKKYIWSDDEDDESISDSTNNKSKKKMIDGSAYTAAATVDEFSGGMDFDIESNSDDDGNASYNGGDDDDDSAAGGGEEVHLCLEDDITSNMGILSKMFPNDSFEKQPLAAPIANDGEENDNVTTNGGVVKQQSSYGGAGLILQRYDPTKESDKRFEVPQVKQDDNDDVEKQPSSQQKEEVKEKDDILSEDTNNEPPTSTIDEEEGEEISAPKEIELPKEEEKVTTNAEEKIAPAKDIYEQDKLDDIFKQAREGKSSFSLTNMFQTDDKNVYEQDKLESVFKEARTDSSGGFSFGFQSELPHDSIPADDDKGGFSFGFDTGNNTSTENEGPEENNTTTDTAPQALPTAMEEAAVHDQPKAKSPTKKRRKGMRFPESDLDKYEDMFFSLNEGPDILKDLDGMKQNEANQEQWQKERLILTADWKRKVKAKKPTKKTRR